jgi:hypothetical protein
MPALPKTRQNKFDRLLDSVIILDGDEIYDYIFS